MQDRIIMAHGSGGDSTKALIEDIFAREFSNEVLGKMEDAAVVKGYENIAFTTDSFVVKPLCFAGGDIGRLSVCGTVNDLLMRGAVPMYLSCGFILETGLEIAVLEKIVRSMAETAREAGVSIVAGDTKVIEGRGGLMINTAGIGEARYGDISAARCCPGDAVILTGSLGDHHAAILSHRMSMKNNILSDCAPLNEIVLSLLEKGVNVHTMRDVTRGGLATVLNEIADSAGTDICIKEEAIPVKDEVRDFCRLLGLEYIFMGNEGKAVIILPEEEADKALDLIRKSRYGEDAALIGRVERGSGRMILENRFGAKRTPGILRGEGLPRIC